MRYYGIELAVGTNVVNLTVEGGAAVPDTNLSAGRLFYNTTTSSLYVCDGVNWNTTGGVAGGVTSFNTRTGDVVLQASDLNGLIGPTNLPKATAVVLGAVKIGAGITVAGDGTISANVSGTTIPSGSRLCWVQASAPTGWTQVTDTSTNNRMLRVVNVAGGTTGSGGTGGGGYGGTMSPILMNVVPAHTHAFTTGTESQPHTHIDAGHTHIVSEPCSNNQGANVAQGFVGFGQDQVHSAWVTTSGSANLGAATAAHTHSGTTANNGSANNWTPQYLNLILCSKD